MSFGNPRRSRGPSGPPAWFVFLIGVAIVFGLYYLLQGAQNFLRTGGRGVQEVTQQAQIISTATAALRRPTANPVLIATPSPVPQCIDFVVSVPNAIVREAPAPNAAILTSYLQGAPVCVLGRAQPDSEWYLIDTNTRTRRIEAAYMHETVVEAVNPTVTPTPTHTPTSTLSPTPTPTVTLTPRVLPSPTDDPSITDTPAPTLTPSPTIPRQSA